MTALPKQRIQISREAAPVRPFAPNLPEGFEVYGGQLFQGGLDLMALLQTPVHVNGHLERPATPAYLRRLTTLRDNFHQLHSWFDAAKARLGYPGSLLVAYASKANPSEPVVRTLLRTGAAYECSSAFDVDILRYAVTQGWVDRERPILANGFKVPPYARALIALRAEGFTGVLPIFDDLEEIEPFAASGLPFEVGLRSRTDADWANRFGLDAEGLVTAAERIMATGNLHLTTFHAMQTVSAGRGLQYQAALVHSLRRYAALRRHVPTLSRFDLGGGLPARRSGIDFGDWMMQTLGTIMAVCADEGVPAPDLIIEPGRYLVQDHAARLFRVVKTRMGSDGVPYYMIDGSIMSSFPDAWALGERFTVLPVNGWEGPFGPARLAGLTCDHDDVYPTRQMDDPPLMLPINAEGLIVGFFDCGAYQETLGGRRGAKHCLLPEGAELTLEPDDEGTLAIRYEPPLVAPAMLGTLGYAAAGFSG